MLAGCPVIVLQVAMCASNLLAVEKLDASALCIWDPSRPHLASLQEGNAKSQVINAALHMECTCWRLVMQSDCHLEYQSKGRTCTGEEQALCHHQPAS